MADVTSLKGIADKDRQMVQGVEAMFGPEPSTTAFAKSLFWGLVPEELVFPYPRVDAEETARCDALLSKLDQYLETEHPGTRIDQEQEIPRSVIDRLFELGVLGMIIPREYGGGGFSVTSHNRVLERIGRTCAATALRKMADRGQITGAIQDGPLAMDNAISPKAAKTKGIASKVAGDADILVAPDLEAGNILAKQLTFLANADAAGLVLGAKVPIILTSRADSVRVRMASCAVAVLVAHARRSGQVDASM